MKKTKLMKMSEMSPRAIYVKPCEPRELRASSGEPRELQG
jgi:hypothetical protein